MGMNFEYVYSPFPPPSSFSIVVLNTVLQIIYFLILFVLEYAAIPVTKQTFRFLNKYSRLFYIDFVFVKEIGTIFMNEQFQNERNL